MGASFAEEDSSDSPKDSSIIGNEDENQGNDQVKGSLSCKRFQEIYSTNCSKYLQNPWILTKEQIYLFFS